MKIYFSDTTTRLIVADYQNGMSIAELAHLECVSTTVIKRILKEQNVELRSKQKKEIREI